MDEPTTLDEWNMNKAYLMRIDQRLTECGLFHFQASYNLWKKTLTSLFKEIYPKMTHDQKLTANNYRVKINKLALDNEGEKFATSLLEFELFLREILEVKGMMTKKSDDPTTIYRGGTVK